MLQPEIGDGFHIRSTGSSPGNSARSKDHLSARARKYQRCRCSVIPKPCTGHLPKIRNPPDPRPSHSSTRTSPPRPTSAAVRADGASAATSVSEPAPPRSPPPPTPEASPACHARPTPRRSHRPRAGPSHGRSPRSLPTSTSSSPRTNGHHAESWPRARTSPRWQPLPAERATDQLQGSYLINGTSLHPHPPINFASRTPPIRQTTTTRSICPIAWRIHTSIRTPPERTHTGGQFSQRSP